METMAKEFPHFKGAVAEPSFSARCALLLALGFLVCSSAQPALCVPSPSDTLALVNGQPITAVVLDQLIMEAKKNNDPEAEGPGMVDRLIKERINNILMVHDALASGMDKEPELLQLMEDRHRSYAIRAYLRDNLVLPASPPADSVMAYFERDYWQIQVRRISLRSWQEAADLRLAVMGGADMDSLARELSLDANKLNGGLYSLQYWADLDTWIRDQVVGLELGEYSGIFPYNDAFSFVRVEQKKPIDKTSFSRIEEKVASDVLAITNQRLRDEFVDGLMATMDLEESMAGLAAIIADSSLVLTGGFLREDPAPVIQLSGGGGVTGTELRLAVFHEVMVNATAPFSENLNKVRRSIASELVLAEAARLRGYYEDPGVVEMMNKDLEQAVIETYLAETVASKIRLTTREIEELSP